MKAETRRTGSLAALAFLAILSTVRQDALAASAYAFLQLGETLTRKSLVADRSAGLFDNDPFPLELQHPAVETAADSFLRAFASESGIVRGFAAIDSPQVDVQAGSAHLTWRKAYRKGLPSDITTFTITSTYLILRLDGPVENLVPSVSYTMSVRLAPGDVSDIAANGDTGWTQQFSHFVKMQANDAGPFLSTEQTMIGGAVVYDSAKDGPSRRVLKLQPHSDIASGYYETAPFKGVVNLGKIDAGTMYTVEYEIHVEGQKVHREGFSHAFVADPLDVDSGFSLTTTSEPVDDAFAASCDAPFDAARYLVNDDSTVTDAYSGLMWQRCPLGYVLNPHGTAADFRDDSCDSAVDSRRSWQAGLQAAASDSSAGHEDWRMPSIKELESIVELQCTAPTIDTTAFPFAAPVSTWSSTPDPLNGAAAKAIDFAFGEVTSRVQTNSAETRLVRDSGQTPLRPGPGISVGRATPVNESDAGTTVLSFPIALDAVASTDVSVEYATQDLSAVAGEDYMPTSGVVVIPAGASQANVQVSVINDSLGELNEALLLGIGNPSSDARLQIARAVGQIDDDEPILTIGGASVGEGDTGTASLIFPITLSAATANDVTVQFATADGTATAPSDYAPGSGTLRIPAGATSGSVVVSINGDTLIEGDEALSVILSDASANSRIAIDRALGTIVDGDSLTLRALNDTGIVLCATDTTFDVACTQTAAFPGQDAQFGRDAMTNDDSDGAAGFSFTKLDAAGTPLADQAAPYTVTPWDCVQDEVTGLQWEVKTDDGGLRDRDWTYTWFNSTDINDGGAAGTANGGVCVDGSNCDTEKYVAAVNVLGMCGRSDWRLATREELQSIADISEFSTAPRYDIRFFPNAPASVFATAYWTSTPDASDPVIAWSVSKLKGRGSAIFAKSRAFPLLLVRGGQ